MTLPETPAGTGSSPPPLTDSGWFWALMFSLMALVAIAVIGPKWDWRQRRAEGLAPVDLAETAADREAVAPGRIVPAWTLVTVAVAAAAGSAAMLWRERRGTLGSSATACPPRARP